MSEEREKKKERHGEFEAEELREVLSVVSKEVPALIKDLMSTVFSEQAGREMGKAAAAYYKSLKEAGMPDETAVRMTEKYMESFTNIGSMMRHSGRSHGQAGSEVAGTVAKTIKEKMAERMEKHVHEEDEDDEDEEDEEDESD